MKEQMKTTTPISSVGADEGQSSNQITGISIADNLMVQHTTFRSNLTQSAAWRLLVHAARMLLSSFKVSVPTHAPR